VNFNVKYFLEQCLFSVTKACININAEIFVIDNNSTDESRQYLELKFPGVLFKWNHTNLGFAKANNIVLTEVSGEYILFLNPDTIVPEDCFENCLSFFKTTKNCGALGVRMLDGSGKYLKESKRSFPSISATFFKMIGFAAIFPSSRIFANYYAGHLSDKQDQEVDVLAGAFMMLSRKALTIVKGFDEDYFMYGEDIDLSYRLQNAGFKNYYLSSVSIIHFKGESTSRKSYGYIRNFYSAMKLFVIKHYKEKKLSFSFILAAIYISSKMASLNLFFKKMLKRKEKKSAAMNVTIVADQPRSDEIINLLKYYKGQVVIRGRITVNEDDRGVSIGNIKFFEQVIRQKGIKQVVFCEGKLTFREIIKLVETINPKIDFLFHADKSTGIVGSNNKHDQGIIISKN